MKKNISLILVIFTLSINLFASNAGDWLEIGPDAIALGMGGAQTAVVKDHTAPFWNPAGIKNNQQIGSTFATLMGDVNYSYFGYVHPFDFGPVGFAFINVGVDGFKYATLTGTTPALSGGEFGFKSNAIMVSYAENLGKLLSTFSFTSGLSQSWMTNTKIGGTFKLLSQSLDKSSSFGYGLDLGLQHQYSAKLSIGGVAYNLFPTNLVWSTGAVENVPIRIKLGAGYQYDEQLLLVADYDLLGYKEAAIYLGAQYQLNQYFCLRGGYQKNALAAGVGLMYQGFNFDMAYTQAATSYLEAATRLSLGYTFPVKTNAKATEVKTVLQKTEQAIAKAETPKLKSIESKKQTIVKADEAPVVTVKELTTEIPPAAEKAFETEPKAVIPILIPDLAAEEVTVRSAKFIVSGYAYDTKTLLINGKKTDLTVNGKYSRTIVLKPGVNIIPIKAYSETKDMVKIVKKIYFK